MGCKENSDLVNSLVGNTNITQKVERVLRLVDRGIFVHPLRADIAYRDAPFRSNNLHPGQIHISAPSIYCTVLEMLDFHKGQSFLNVGSGSGYLSVAVGFFLGEHGTSHGVELYSNVIDHARDAVHLFASQKFIAGYDWCRPQFAHGNAFLLKGISKRYDRIYVGAQIDQTNVALFSEMLKEDGIMIAPVLVEQGGTRFTRVKRTSDGFERIEFMSVAFAELIPPNMEDRPEPSAASRKRKYFEEPTNPNEDVTEDLLALFNPKSLEVLSSYVIRKRIADALRVSHPIAIVQRVRNKLTPEEVMGNTLRRHNRGFVRRGFNNDLLINIPIPVHLRFPFLAHRQGVLDERAERLQERADRLQERADRLEERAERMEDDEEAEAGLGGGMEGDVQRLEERLEAAFNRAVAGVHDEEPFPMADQLMNIMRREVEARAQWEQLRRDVNDVDGEFSDEDVDEESEEEQEDAEDAENADELLAERGLVDQIRRLHEQHEEEEAMLEAQDDWIEFRPFRVRTRRPDNDGEMSTDQTRRPRPCTKCLNVCKCTVPTLKAVATKVMNSHRNARLNRRAKAQPWVQRITRLIGPHKKPKSFAEQVPGIFEEDICTTLPNGCLAIEDWYLQKKRCKFLGQLAALEEAVRETGKLQFQQENNDFQEVEALAEYDKVFMVSFKNEEDSIARFEKKIVEVLNQLPLPENGRKALKWNLFRDD